MGGLRKSPGFFRYLKQLENLGMEIGRAMMKSKPSLLPVAELKGSAL